MVTERNGKPAEARARLIDADRMHPFLIEELVSGVEQSLTG